MRNDSSPSSSRRRPSQESAAHPSNGKPHRRRLRLEESEDGALVLTLHLAPDGRSSRAVVDLTDLARVFRQTMPDEVVLDLHLPIRSGLSLIRILEAACPGVAILAHVHSRMGAPRLYTVTLDGTRLSLKPLPDSIAGTCGSA